MIETSHLHPILVHFPIALILTGFLADLIALFRKEKWWSNTGFFLMVLGTLGAVAAVASGILFTSEPSEGEVVSVYMQHRTAAFITFALMIVVTSLRILLFYRHQEDRFNRGIFVLYLFGAILISYTGYLGGTMVYTYFLGV